jgi:hypothetical protein
MSCIVNSAASTGATIGTATGTAVGESVSSGVGSQIVQTKRSGVDSQSRETRAEAHLRVGGVQMSSSHEGLLTHIRV